ncbi:MAG: hypothetical protein ACRC2N_06380 [Aeromonas sp.]|nr:hypothetical protein [Aeromonas jandaei]QSR72880.1 hypothetical protein GP488_10790 [Aeromonas jandaei]
MTTPFCGQLSGEYHFHTHYDHCSPNVYMLMGGAAPCLQLAYEPSSEEELIEMLRQLACC